ncbi:chitin synthase [Plakobranchus ocellatus]|uniref:Chitin synthase n=1 Tax=Plakobranchus ocellatus TaxID=259542 RepID=A0AAV3Z4G8_9GAST|nr:chitin synthase [Plakobranchus ocellatus]
MLKGGQETGETSVEGSSRSQRAIPLSEAEEDVEDWLDRISHEVEQSSENTRYVPLDSMNTYADILRRHGFDTTLFVKGLNEKELRRLGITNEGHIQFLLSRIARLPAFEIQVGVPDNVSVWLRTIGLARYEENFARNLIRTPKEMEILKKLKQRKIEDQLEIKLPGHIKRLLYAITKLRFPTEVESRVLTMRQELMSDLQLSNGEGFRQEFENWQKLLDICLKPDLKAFGMEAEVKVNLIRLRNSWLTILAVANTLWLILVVTLADRANLTVIGANPVGLSFLFIFGLLFLIQFVAMLYHRVLTLSHYLARAAYKCDKCCMTGPSSCQRQSNEESPTEDGAPVV